MKKTLLLCATLLFAAGVAAQNPTAYFMEGSTFRTQFNPALAPQRGYFNLPVAGAVGVDMSNTVALDDFLFRRDGKLVSLLDPAVSTAEALRGIHDKNVVGAQLRMNVIGFGKYTRNRKNFWSFGIDLRADAEVSIPGSMVRFVKQGDAGTIRNMGLSMSSYLDAGFSYSFPLLGDKLYVGAKARFLVGLARVGIDFDRIDITLQEDRWAVRAEGTLDANIPGSEVEYRYDENRLPYFEPKDLDFSLGKLKPAGYGFAVDLGATYEILPDLKASLAVVDLGFIAWNRGTSVRGSSTVESEYTGVAVENGETISSPDFSIEELTRFRTADEKNSARMLRATMNASAEYSMWRHRVVFGLLYQARFHDYKTLHSLTGSVNFSPIRWFTLSGSYTVGSCGGSLGVALNLCPGWINFFVGADFLTARLSPQYVPVAQRSAHVTFGLGFPLGKRGLRLKEYAGASVRK
ncbi:MAG: DUF5723 family protein [Alistipes sp.]|nr:DUF5723 family protein [Alistipes senegalensis]MCM1251140.1 DUF5723 family protein [Alistipes sp.]